MRRFSVTATNFTRQFSSKSTVINLSKESQEVFSAYYSKVKDFFETHPHSKLKTRNEAVIKSGVSFLRSNLLAADKNLQKEIDHIKNLDPEIISIPNIPLLDFNLDKFPDCKSDLESQKFLQETITSTVTICCWADLFGIEFHRPTFIFNDPSAAPYEFVNTDKNLEWHNDGWQLSTNDQIDRYSKLLFLGILQEKRTFTEVLTVKDITEHLQEIGRGDLLKKLQEEHFFGYDIHDDYTQIMGPILGIDGVARFSSRAAASIRSSGNDHVIEFAEILNTIKPSFEISMKLGDLLLVDNLRTLHQRRVSENSQQQDQDKRLLLKLNAGLCIKQPSPTIQKAESDVISPQNISHNA